ncbi:unnamed protein product [Microthlaspi erraticum]|uniref:SGNH hydrolase-type esterase domain-containing protein n=1 Tax=Microthlaspi erraticum TaxID=1685480 RepID=A0A6D2JKA4_9BRAS|nr:unnamed protein product [Microthlaspi erraticum]
MGLPSSLKPYLLVLLFCFLNVSTVNSTKQLKEEAVFFGGNFPALYVIGDSLVDSGNNNYLPARLKANFTPYGFNFEGGKPTGRFSDGKTIADYIAIYYELPLVPVYMGLSEKQKNIISTGINYASGGCGVYPNTGQQQAGPCLSMGVQVDLFNQTIKKNLKQNFKTQSKLNNHLADSLFLIAIGTNDYGFTYNESSTNANSFAEKLLNEYWLQIQISSFFLFFFQAPLPRSVHSKLTS